MDETSCPRCGLPVGSRDERCRSCGWLILRPAPAMAPAVRLAAWSEPGEPAAPGRVGPLTAESVPPPPARSAAPQGAPGYPAYPQGAQPSYTPYPYPAYPPGYGAPGAPGAGTPYPPYPFYYYVPAPPRKPIYPLIVSWIVTVVGGLSVICGLLILALVALFNNGQAPTSLSGLGASVVYIIAPIGGGVIAMVGGIFGILRRPSPPFSLSWSALLLGLSVLSYAAAMVLWNVYPMPGPVLAALPLVIACVSLPSLTILAFAAERLGSPSTRRHVWLSFAYGTTLAALVAGLANTIFAIIVVLILRLLGFNIDFSAADLSSANPQDSGTLLALLLVVSVVAPIVEETTKPLGALLIVRRLRTPGEAFLVGMASGIGFAIVETLGDYVGQGQADWISVALERSTSGLLHGVGAGMGALGWYYLINGKGVPLRWLRGIGCFVYAVLQHGIYNGAVTVIGLLPGIGPVFREPIPFVSPPIGWEIAVIIFYDLLILVFLIYITGRLRASRTSRPVDATPAPAATFPQMQPVAGGAR